MERDPVLVKRDNDVRRLSKNGMFIPVDLLPVIISVKGQKGVEILGDSLLGGQKTLRPKEMVGIRIFFEDVPDYDRFGLM